MDSYVTNVQLFLDSGCKSIEEYFCDNVDDKQLLGNCLEIVNLINNGVVLPNGEVREFDLVDYYSRTNLNKPRFNDVVGDAISHDEFVKVSRFFAKYKGDRPIEGGEVDNLYTTKMSFPCKWDSNGRVISYYEATKEDIMDAIISIGEKGIPLTSMTFGIVLKNRVLENISEKNLTNYEKCV